MDGLDFVGGRWSARDSMGFLHEAVEWLHKARSLDHTLLTMGASFALLAISMKRLPLGTAYMVWTGIGAVGAFLAEIMLLGGHASTARILAASFIIAGIVMMKFSVA